MRVGGRVANVEEPCVMWRKSTASNTDGCVEVAAVAGSILVRDSVNQDGAVLRLPPAVWSDFLVRTCGKDSGLA